MIKILETFSAEEKKLIFEENVWGVDGYERENDESNKKVFVLKHKR